jgi:hypothetical protein
MRSLCGIEGCFPHRSFCGEAIGMWAILSRPHTHHCSTLQLMSCSRSCNPGYHARCLGLVNIFVNLFFVTVLLSYHPFPPRYAAVCVSFCEKRRVAPVGKRVDYGDSTCREERRFLTCTLCTGYLCHRVAWKRRRTNLQKRRDWTSVFCHQHSPISTPARRLAYLTQDALEICTPRVHSSFGAPEEPESETLL